MDTNSQRCQKVKEKLKNARTLELIAKADDMLRNPYYTDSTLFEDVNIVARNQQVNDLRIQHSLIKKDTFAAATMAMRSWWRTNTLLILC